MGRRKIFSYEEAYLAIFLFVLLGIYIYSFYLLYDARYHVANVALLEKCELFRLLQKNELYKTWFGVDFRFGLDVQKVMLHKSYIYYFGRKPIYLYASNSDLVITPLVPTRLGVFFPHEYHKEITRFHLEYPFVKKYIYDLPFGVKWSPGYVDIDSFSAGAIIWLVSVLSIIVGSGVRISYSVICVLPFFYVFSTHLWY